MKYTLPQTVRSGLLAVLLGLSPLAIANAQPFFGLEDIPVSQYEEIEQAIPPMGSAELPASIDLSYYFPVPGNQNPQQSCVGWAVAYALKTFHESIESGVSPNTPEGQIKADRVFSPSFVYNQINSGLNIPTDFFDALRILQTQGAAPWSYMPYNGDDYRSQPSAAAKEAAKNYRINSWQRIDTDDVIGLKAALVARRPIVIGAKIDEFFAYRLGAENWDRFRGPTIGNHAMVVVGYDDARGAFKVINSWGRNWGDAGFGWISYDFFPQSVPYAFVVFDETSDPTADLPTSNPEKPWLPPASPFDQAQITINEHYHNANFGPALGPGMILKGIVFIPPNARGKIRVAAAVTTRDGEPVRSNFPQFRLLNDQLATATPVLEVDGGAAGITIPWTLFLPYCAGDLPSAVVCTGTPQAGGPFTTLLRTTPILYVDDVSKAQAQVYDFVVAL